MSNLGYVKKTGENAYEGTLNLLSFSGPVKILPLPQQSRLSENAPDMRVVVTNRTGGMTEIGTARNRVGRESGKPYVSVAIKHPQLVTAPLFCNLGAANDTDEEDVFALIA